MSRTSIEWTRGDDGTPGRTWNPVSGCTKVSPGCDHCYAENIARRFAGGPAFPRGFDVTLRPEKLDAPLRWRKPARVFVNSMSDLFHDEVSDEFIGSVFEVMAKTPQHTYQVLTKRHRRMRSLLTRWAEEGARHDWAGAGTAVFRRHDLVWVGPVRWPLPNVWLGVSVEDQKRADLRIPALLDTPAAVRFLSCEPLLGPVDLDGPVDVHGGRPKLTYWLHGRPGWSDEPTTHEPYKAVTYAPTVGPRIDWVIVGGESGPRARPMHTDWPRQLRDQCQHAGVPFFFKQWGEWRPLAGNECAQAGDDWPAGTRGAMSRRVGKKAAGRELDGRTWDEFPVVSA